MKPSDFFIGVIDFFSVIVPGAVLTFFLKGLFYPKLFGDGAIFPELHTEVQKIVAFLAATYILGHLVFPVGSLLLDKFVYDKLLRNPLFKRNFDLAYLVATRIRDEHISSEDEIRQQIDEGNLGAEEIQKLVVRPKREVINTFKWAQKYLALKPPATLTEIQKLEADSKFFRSLAVVFVIIGSLLLVNTEWLWGGVFFVLALLSIYRYGDLRYKSTEYAYEQIIAINHLEKLPPELAAPSRDNRSQFLASPETVAAHRTRIDDLTKETSVATQVLAIAPNETWSVTNSLGAETIVCLEGYGILKSPDTTHQSAVYISPATILHVPARSNFEIHNAADDKLVLLCVR